MYNTAMVRTRIAPSPTGNDIHIGNLYTALINWVVAKKNNGQFIVRIEDTDRTRYVEGAEEKILQSLADYGLVNDEGPNVGGPYAPYRQSERLSLYQKYAEELVEKGKAYYSFVTKEQLENFRNEATRLSKLELEEDIEMIMLSETKDRLRDLIKAGMDAQTKAKILLRTMLQNPSVAAFSVEEGKRRIETEKEYTIRLLVPENQDIVFNDLIRGDISINTNQVDDQVLLKSDGFPTYHLGVVVDDNAMKISHIIRAEEWISSTPKHVLLYDAFGWERPVFCHLPILRNPDKSKLSKRKNPVWAHWYIEQGYLPEAMINYLALMGWSHPEQKEIFFIDEFIKTFELKDISPVGPAFDKKKLDWMNGMHIRLKSDEQLTNLLMEFYKAEYDKEFVYKVVPLIKERIKTLSEFKDYVSFFLQRPTSYEIDMNENKEVLSAVEAKIQTVLDWSAEAIGLAMQEVASSSGMKNGPFFQLLRVAITGRKISPPLNESMELLGKEECLQRIQVIK